MPRWMWSVICTTKYTRNIVLPGISGTILFNITFLTLEIPLLGLQDMSVLSMRILLVLNFPTSQATVQILHQPWPFLV